MVQAAKKAAQVGSAATVEVTEERVVAKSRTSRTTGAGVATSLIETATASAVTTPLRSAKPRRGKKAAAAADDGANADHAEPHQALADKQATQTTKRASSTKQGSTRSKKAKVAVDEGATSTADPSTRDACADEPPADASGADAVEGEDKPKKRRGSALPNLPVGIKYDASTMRRPRLESGGRCLMSWNVAGLRGLLKKDPRALERLVEAERVDVLCLQEHKLQTKGVEEAVAALAMEGWSASFACSTSKLGYSGVATLTRRATVGAPLSVRFGLGHEEHDQEGRVLTVELPDIWVVNVYSPNSGENLKRVDYRCNEFDKAVSEFVLGLQATKPVVLTGDLNCAREPIDIHNARGNVKSAGFSPQERESFQEVYMDKGFVDTFREQHPGIYGYTFFGRRMNMHAKGKGWRLDYFLVSSSLASRCHDSFILQDFAGSDHYPLGLVLKDND